MDAEQIARAVVDGFKESGKARAGMPDHPLRQSRAFQLYVRLARPTLDWVGVVSALYAGLIGHAIGKPMSVEYALVVFFFAGSLFGIRTLEKIKGVA
jgi:hypothetical protein